MYPVISHYLTCIYNFPVTLLLKYIYNLLNSLSVVDAREKEPIGPKRHRVTTYRTFYKGNIIDVLGPRP